MHKLCYLIMQSISELASTGTEYIVDYKVRGICLGLVTRKSVFGFADHTQTRLFTNSRKRQVLDFRLGNWRKYTILTDFKNATPLISSPEPKAHR